MVHCGGVVYEGVQQDYDLAYEYLSGIIPMSVFTPAGGDIHYCGYSLFPRYFSDLDQSYRNDCISCTGISSAQYNSPIGTIGDTARKSLLNHIQAAKQPVKAVFCITMLFPSPPRKQGAHGGQRLLGIWENS
jgi:hypothetical protein